MKEKVFDRKPNTSMKFNGETFYLYKKTDRKGYLNCIEHRCKKEGYLFRIEFNNGKWFIYTRKPTRHKIKGVN